MENIPVPPYPGPPLESTSSVQQRTFTQLAAQTHHITAEAHHYNQQSPGPQHHRSLPMENIPVPPYPGPPLEYQSTSSVQQRAFTHQPAPQTYHTTAEDGPCNNQQSHSLQNPRSLPMEKIPVPPYPGPHLESQSTSSVQQRAFTQLDAQTHHISAEAHHYNQQSPGPQHHRSLPIENIPAPPYPGPLLESQATSSVQQRAFTDQPAPQTHHIPSEGGPRTNLHFPGPQRQSSLPTENIPAPPYPGPPLGFAPTNTLEQRAYTRQPAHCGHCPSAEESPFTHLPSPHPHHPCQHQELSGNSGTCRAVDKGAFTPKPAPHAHYDNDKGIPCEHSHSYCNPTFHPQHSKHSPAYMEKEINPSMFYEPPLNFKSQGCMQEKVFAQQDTPYKHYAPVQGANSSYDFIQKRSVEMPSEKAFCMDKMSESLKRDVSLEQNNFTHVHRAQAESHSNSEKSTIETFRQTKEYMRLCTDSASTASYSSSTLNLQIPSQTVQQIPGTSASMYSYYSASALQPGVQVVHAGGTQVVVQPQRQTVVVPSMASPTIIQPVAAQPAMVIQPATPAIRVIQPQVLPTVIQPAANNVVYRRYY